MSLNGHPRAFVLTLRGATERFAKCQEHFKESGVTAEPFYGLDYRITGLRTDHKYEIDNPGYQLGPKQVSLHLSHYMLWMVLSYQPEDEFIILEDDCRFDKDWLPRFQSAYSVLPKDWDFCWLGHCCAYDKPQWKVDKNLYVVNYPLCTHFYMLRKKVIPVLLEKCMKVWSPVDISLVLDAMPGLKHFTVLPRLGDQFNTSLPL